MAPRFAVRLGHRLADIVQDGRQQQHGLLIVRKIERGEQPLHHLQDVARVFHDTDLALRLRPGEQDPLDQLLVVVRFDNRHRIVLNRSGRSTTKRPSFMRSVYRARFKKPNSPRESRGRRHRLALLNGRIRFQLRPSWR